MTSPLRFIRRLFTVKTRFEAFLIIYALGLGASERGIHYMQMMPGWPGKMMAVACTGAVFLGGGLIIDAITLKRAYEG
jgi:hypothetical protein